MLTFKDITLADRETIIKYTMDSPHRNCDLSFSNLYSWRFLYGTQYAESDGFLILKFWADGELSYMMPIGKGNLMTVLEKMIADSQQEQSKFCMLGVCETMKTELDEVMPGLFTFQTDRAYADYVYLREDLATLSGKKYQAKRNHINKFRKSYNYEYLPITKDHIGECLRLEAEWCRTNNCSEEAGMNAERRAIIQALTHFEELKLLGGLLRVDNDIVAFTFGAPINNDTFGVHVEKADTDIDGAYAMINYEFANHVPTQYTYLNREEDLGMEGLRKAKLSYYPTILLEKAVVCYKK
ncbi:DUF2156 domain-containing protein [Bacteroides sp. 214]|uniref:DUF2156 domain-containing protein n=1 Tax=Bacteroides sp. 214 TaxID=2302935 RepID=UPI0013D67BEB|nr:phosphatidylglycerol lysyltransferase domain-containing protein [Bacteroides sp. 214]NDW12538.1 DUF2156 domain-containing protein [Bacteroides sp. 214]